MANGNCGYTPPRGETGPERLIPNVTPEWGVTGGVDGIGGDLFIRFVPVPDCGPVVAGGASASSGDSDTTAIVPVVVTGGPKDGPKTSVITSTSKESSEKDTKESKKRGLWVPILVVLALGAGALGLSQCNRNDGRDPVVGDPTEEPGNPTGNPTGDPRIIDIFTVDTTKLDCVEDIVKPKGELRKLDIVPFDIGALKPVGNGVDHRKYADSLSTAFKNNANNPEKLEQELRKALCQDPELLVTFANLLAHLTIDGVRIVDLNPEWLGEHNVDASEIDRQAAEFVPGLDKENMSDAELKFAIQKNQEMQKLAEYVIETIDRMRNAGVNIDMTTLNYHLAGGGMDVQGLPEVELNDRQYEGYFLEFKVTFKDGSCPVSILVNLLDKRPALGETCNVEITKDIVVPTTIVIHQNGTTTTTYSNGTTTTTSTTTTTVPSTTTSTRVEVPPVAPTVIQGDGVGGETDPDDDPDNEVTTTQAHTPTTSSPGTTVAATSVTDTTIGRCDVNNNPDCE